jgi:hypothetical protein
MGEATERLEHDKDMLFFQKGEVGDKKVSETPV